MPQFAARASEMLDPVIASPYGHDGFLIGVGAVGARLRDPLA